jgi:casein kinase II subunit beta
MVASIIIQAKQLYGLLHSRWICQSKGLAQMKRKFERGVFGECPRWNCHDQRLLPMGTTIKPRHHSVKLFCPQCRDIYVAPTTMRIDGAHFGPAFPHMFLFEYPECDAHALFRPVVLKAFGFPLHKSRRRFEPHATNKHEEETPIIDMDDT